MTAQLDMRQVVVEVGKTRLLGPVDLTVSPSEWVGLIGPNGAGKTTLLNAISGVTESNGDISVNSHDLSHLSAVTRAQLVALVPQRPVVPSGMEAFTYVLLGRTPHLGFWGSENRSDIEIARNAMKDLGVDELADRDIATLSSGELQRVVLARALSQEADILLLDEPTSALDVGNQQQVLEVIDTLRGSRRLTVLSAIHDLSLAAQFCDRLVLLSDGHIACTGPPEAVLTEETIRVHYDANVNIVWIDDQLAVIPTRQRRDTRP